VKCISIYWIVLAWFTNATVRQTDRHCDSKGFTKLRGQKPCSDTNYSLFVNRKCSSAVGLTTIAIMSKRVKACVSESNSELSRRSLNEVTGSAQLSQVRMSHTVTLRYCYTVGDVSISTIPVRSQSVCNSTDKSASVHEFTLKYLSVEPLHQTGSIYTANHKKHTQGRI